MKNKVFPSLVLLLIAFSAAFAQEPDSLVLDFSDEYLDTVKIDHSAELNNYYMIGFSYGSVIPGMMFNPSYSQERDFLWGDWCINFSHYEKMFDYLPYFGWSIGLEYTWEGYHFKTNKETGETFEFFKERSRAIRMRVLEVPFLLQIHKDSRFSKVYAQAGIYGGYRTSVERFGPNVEEEYRYAFYDTDIRWDYGFQGGVGLALVLDPVEFHIGAGLRYSLSSVFTPNSLYPEGSGFEDRNSVYYRYAYPLDFMITAGVQFHLSKRFGKTRQDIKKEAKSIVYGTDKQ